jgi:UDP-3-O-[3-hydroxymyristoyl] glucosamine N-acyltransferase
MTRVLGGSMAPQVREIVETFPELLSLARGSGDIHVSRIQNAPSASSEDLIFVATPLLLKEALKSKSQAWVVAPDLLSKVPANVGCVVQSSNVPLAMALVSKRFFPQTLGHQAISGSKIHDWARVSESATIGENCIIGPGAVVGDGCRIGDRAIIGANAVVEANVVIGKDSYIHPLVFIAHSCEVGERCEIMPHTTIGGEGFGYAQDKAFNHTRITHYGRVIIENDVHIGSGVQIDRGTFDDSVIGAGTKIDNHCHFGHNIRIGKNTLITGGFIAAGSVSVGSYSVFGGRTTVSGHLSLGDKVKVGGMSGITKSITEPGEYAGFPLQDLKSSMRTRAAIKSLPDLIKQVRRILKHLGLESDSEKMD